MQGSKGQKRRNRKIAAKYRQGWTHNCNFEGQLRKVSVYVDIPSGGSYKKFFTFFEWN